MYQLFVKRLLDIILSLLAIIILSPLYLIIAVCVRIGMGKPVLFSQERIGKDEKTFCLYKFRSMTNKKDKNGNLLPEKDRLTKCGEILRTLSLDELPELFMILKGDMSFVGPRPLPTYYGPYFFPDERKRHQVRGGLIPPDGLSKKTTPKWEVQFEYDNYYVDHVSFLLDCKVIIVTFLILFKRVENNYGAELRPHLNEYRSWLDIEKETEQNVLSIR
ncbi:MAG: sugar transferase [Dysgonamonadaceae bacterium]|nr:sugar transferase [Dysgonamonadaceae bacterium]